MTGVRAASAHPFTPELVTDEHEGVDMNRPQHSPASAADAAHLERCVELAARGPAADPNPRVGAVLVTDEGMVAEGFHRGSGTPHAEAVVLSEAGERARGATVYVSLEPCAHVGRTAACAQALLDAGVSRVVYASADPNPAAAGGAELLRAAGMRVEHVPRAAADELNRRWACAVSRDRPFVTWKVGATLDGRVAAADGTSRWITGAASRTDVHRLRAECGAVVVGTGTVLTDDPSLTVRGPDQSPAVEQPLRVVIGARPVPPDAAVRATDDWLHLTEHAPHDALAALHERQIRHVLLEGGPTVAAAWLGAGVIDEVLAYIAPTLLGAGPSLIADLSVPTLTAARRLTLLDVERLEDDVRLRLRPETHPTPVSA